MNNYKCKWKDSGDKDLIAKVKNLPYNKKEWIYEQSEDRKSRFLLGKRGKRTLICCGVNPSTASPNDLDPTMKSVEKIAQANGYDSYLMINLYPMRATDPKDVHEQADKMIINKNVECIESVLNGAEYDIWAAWGNLIKTREYLKDCLCQLAEVADTYQCKWFCVSDLTKEGHPRHPLYVKRDAKLKMFDIDKYLRDILS